MKITRIGPVLILVLTPTYLYPRKFSNQLVSELGKHCDIIVRADCLEAVIYHGYTQFVRFNWS